MGFNEERYDFIEGSNRITGGTYTNEKGEVIMQSRYVKKLNWFERVIEKVRILKDHQELRRKIEGQKR